jgi:hypothetical protein
VVFLGNGDADYFFLDAGLVLLPYALLFALWACCCEILLELGTLINVLAKLPNYNIVEESS